MRIATSLFVTVLRVTVPCVTVLWPLPARTDPLRPPVDAAVWRTIEGAGGDARRHVGLGPFIAAPLIAEWLVFGAPADR